METTLIFHNSTIKHCVRKIYGDLSVYSSIHQGPTAKAPLNLCANQQFMSFNRKKLLHNELLKYHIRNYSHKANGVKLRLHSFVLFTTCFCDFSFATGIKLYQVLKHSFRLKLNTKFPSINGE